MLTPALRLPVAIGAAIILLPVLLFSLGSCRVSMSRAEKERLRTAIRDESAQQESTQVSRDRAWEALRQRFDKDKNGTLSPAESAAFDRHVEKIRIGKEPNPFPSP